MKTKHPKQQERDDVIREIYRAAPADWTADAITENPSMAEQFLSDVNTNLPADARYDDLAELNHRLKNLRRKGEANGGLARKHQHPTQPR